MHWQANGKGEQESCGNGDKRPAGIAASREEREDFVGKVEDEATLGKDLTERFGLDGNLQFGAGHRFKLIYSSVCVFHVCVSSLGVGVLERIVNLIFL